MPESKDPVIDFLMQDNGSLLAALELLPYGPQLREKVAERFWSGLRSQIQDTMPELQTFTWKRDYEEECGCRLSKTKADWDKVLLGERDDWSFRLLAIPEEARESNQGLKYIIETWPEAYAFGLAWLNRPTAAYTKLSSMAKVREILDDLKRPPVLPEFAKGWVDAPNESTLWYGYLTKAPYKDPWVWFARDFRIEWPHEKVADRFCDFVKQTRKAVAEANKALGSGEPG